MKFTNRKWANPEMIENSFELLNQFPIGIILLNKDFEIAFINKNLFYFGVLKDENPSVGSNIINRELLTDNEMLYNLDSLKEGIAFEYELKKVKTLNGLDISTIVKGVPIFDEGNFDGAILIAEDIKTAQRAQSDPGGSVESVSLAKNISDFFIVTNPTGLIKSFSDNEKLIHLFSNIQVGKNINDLLQENLAKFIDESIKKVNSNKSAFIEEFKFEHNSEIQILKFQFAPILSGDNKVTSIFILINDITSEYIENNEQIETINELKKYELLINSTVDAVITLDIEGKINFWNKNSANLLGFSRSQVFGKFIGKIFPDINENYFESIKKELQENITWNSDIEFKKGNETNFLDLRMSLLNEEEDESIVILISDITQRKYLESDLRLSEERFRNIVTNTKEYICTLDLDGNLTYANPAFKETFNLEEIKDNEIKFFDLFDLTDEKKDNFNIEQIIENELFSLELQLTKNENEILYFFASFSTIYNSQKTPIYLNVILTDITTKKKAERDLLLIRSVLNASQDGIIVINNREIVIANDFYAKMFGYESKDEIIGMDPLDFIVDKDIPSVAKKIKILEEGNPVENKYEFRGKTKDGSEIIIESSDSSYKTDDNTFIVSVYRDITEQKKAQLLLEESEAKYRGIAENLNEFIWTAEYISGQLTIVFITSSVEKITGYASEDFLNDHRLWLRIIHPNDQKYVLSKLKRLLNDSTKESEEMEFRVINIQGQIIWVQNKISVKKDEKGNITKLIGLVSDISLSIKAKEDLKQSTEELQQLNETKDRFISIISHDLRTPFSSILGFTDILLSDDGISPKKQKEYINFIQESSKNMLSLVNSLLDWTRLQTGRIKFEPHRMDIRKTAEKAIQMISGTALQKKIEIVSEFENPIHIHADENLILQVFNNLLSNAVKFTPGNGKIVLGYEPQLNKKMIKFEVRDSGVGIKAEDKEKLFKVDTKFTTRGTSGETGSGLGLSLCHEIVQKHGGNIWVESEPGKGTSFQFTIPISSTTILLVDDAKTDRMLYKKLLQSMISEYNIEEANNGKEALEIINAIQPALVITDHNMPEMSGMEMIKSIMLSEKRYRPPMIVLSSDINDSIIEEYKEFGIDYVFEKPVNINTFKSAVDNSLKKAIYN